MGMRPGASARAGACRSVIQTPSSTSLGASSAAGHSHITGAPLIENVGRVLYATDTFTNTSYERSGGYKATWSRPGFSRVAGDFKGVIASDQAVTIQGSFNNLASGPTPSNISPQSASTQSPAGPNSSPRKLPHNGLFTLNTQPDMHPVVETHPYFTNYRTWLSSNYIAAQRVLDPNVTEKRLGDGFYEQRLVREQIAELTGKRFLGHYTNDDQQYKGLMDAGVAYAKAFNLRQGIALSAAQMEYMTSPLVWLVEETVLLPKGGTQKVLVPRFMPAKS